MNRPQMFKLVLAEIRNLGANQDEVNSIITHAKENKFVFDGEFEAQLASHKETSEEDFKEKVAEVAQAAMAWLKTKEALDTPAPKNPALENPAPTLPVPAPTFPVTGNDPLVIEDILNQIQPKTGAKSNAKSQEALLKEEYQRGFKVGTERERGLWEEEQWSGRSRAIAGALVGLAFTIFGGAVFGGFGSDLAKGQADGFDTSGYETQVSSLESDLATTKSKLEAEQSAKQFEIDAHEKLKKIMESSTAVMPENEAIEKLQAKLAEVKVVAETAADSRDMAIVWIEGFNRYVSPHWDSLPPEAQKGITETSMKSDALNGRIKKALMAEK